MNAINLQRLRFNMKKFNCINDNLSHKDIEGLVENLKFCQSSKKSVLKCNTSFGFENLSEDSKLWNARNACDL